MILGLFAVCWIVFIGQDCVKMSDPIWLVVLSAWLVSLYVPAGLPWATSRSVISGTE